jgi:hypothetical protein
MIEKCFITGCDSKTDWQLPWCLKNYKKHVSNIPIYVMNFGMTEKGLEAASILSDGILDLKQVNRKGWFRKPEAMLSSPAKMTCWIDTDCEIVSDASTIFDHLQPNKLNMVVDHPWSIRRNTMGKWHNSGVVAFIDKPTILNEWYHTTLKRTDIEGDQEVLYWMMGGDELRRLTYIHDLPHKYNVLRLDYEDGKAPPSPVINHWTGEKGNVEILKQIKNNYG